MSSAFEFLHPAVQRRLWEMRWTALRPIQDQAIQHLLGKGGDCIVSAPTAGGKTEAAFLPILSKIAEDAAGGVRAMYVGPLKALINDQFQRVENLCERLQVPVHKWHGDVTDAQRRALLQQPSGVLLITPESLEAMFILRPAKMPAIFSRLKFVVIDELHSFIDSVRGAQLLSQLHRLRERCGCDPVRVGLSATLGDPAKACAWLRRDGTPATYIEDAEAERRLAVKVRGLWKMPPKVSADEDEGEEDEADPVLGELARSILRACHTTTNLAFANAKGDIETLADAMKEQAESMGLRHDVVVHHGSLSKEQRESAEERLRSELPCTAVCSNTLEMGIDIGEIDSVVQVSSPWSVASLSQRLGRSGRRAGGTAVLRAFFVEESLDEQSTFWDGLHLNFLRGVAMVELMVAKFSEPPATIRHHYSTLIHQLLSILAETKGLAASRAYQHLVACGAFGPLSTSEFAGLLRELAAKDLVGQAPGGDIILGTRGERLCDHYSFYAAFATPEEFRVLHGMTEIGKLQATALPLVGEPVILAGRRWVVLEIDTDRKEVRVAPTRARRKPEYLSSLADIHPRVHAKMRELATTSEVPAYLDDVARGMLEQVRKTAADARLFEPRLVALDGGEVSRVFVWGGSRVQRTLRLALRAGGLPLSDMVVGLDVGAPVPKVREALAAFAARPDATRLSQLAVRELNARASGDKFDNLVPEALWARAFAAERLDVEGAVAWCSGSLAGTTGADR